MNSTNLSNPYLRALADTETAIVPGALYRRMARPDDPALPSEMLARQVIPPMLDAFAAYLRTEPTLAREMTEGEMTLTLARELFYAVVACKFYGLSGRWPDVEELTPWATAPEYLPGRLGMARLLLAPSAANLWPDSSVLALPFTRATLHADFTKHLGWHATEEGTRALLREALAYRQQDVDEYQQDVDDSDAERQDDPFAPVTEEQGDELQMSAFEDDAPHLLDDEDGRRWAIPTEVTLDTGLGTAPLGAVVEAVLPTVCAAFVRVIEASGSAKTPPLPGVDMSPLNVLLNLGREAVGASFALRAQARGITLERADVDAWFWTGDGLTLTTSAARFIAREARFPDVPGLPVTQADLARAFDAHFGGIPDARFVALDGLSFDVKAFLPDGAAPRCRFITGNDLGTRVRAGRVRRATAHGKENA